MKKTKTKKILKPGFYYWGGCINEVDSKGKSHPRRDLEPNHKGAFKRKFK